MKPFSALIASTLVPSARVAWTTLFFLAPAFDLTPTLRAPRFDPFAPFSSVLSASSSQLQAAESENGDIPSRLAGLFRPISLETTDAPLDSFLERYSRSFKFAYFIDRRVDPSTPISGSFAEVPLLEALGETLDAADLSFCVVGDSLVYVGPRDASGELSLLLALNREKAADAPKGVAEKLAATIEFSTRELQEPQAIFADLSRRAKIKFAGFEKTPFDRWRATDFGALPVSDLTTLLVFGFGVDYRWSPNAKAVRPVKLDRTRTVERDYPQDVASKLAVKDYPTCRFEKKNAETTRVVGPFADVAKVERAVSRERRRRWSARADASANSPRSTSPEIAASPNALKSTARKVAVTGKVKTNLKSLFAYLRKSANATFELDPSAKAAGVSLETRVECEFKNADLERIAATVAAEIDLEYRIDESRVVFFKE